MTPPAPPIPLDLQLARQQRRVPPAAHQLLELQLPATLVPPVPRRRGLIERLLDRQVRAAVRGAFEDPDVHAAIHDLVVSVTRAGRP